MTNTRSRIVLCALAAVAAGPVAAETYKWVDAQGQVHYSDRPPPQGAEKVELLPAQAYRAPAAARTAAKAPASKDGAVVAYTEFEMRTPQSGEVITNAGGNVNVQVRLQPDLQPGHSILIYLDGKRVDGIPTTGLSFPLVNVIRGEHHLVAVIVDRAAKSLASTPAVTFVVRQHSIAKPPQGPALHH
jgi:hypothetical protein